MDGPVSIDNIIDGDYVRLEADEYLRAFNQVLPGWGCTIDSNSPHCDIATAILYLRWFSLIFLEIAPSKWEAALFPILVQQNQFEFGFESRRLSFIEISFTKPSYMISVNGISVCAFVGLSVGVILFCTGIALKSGIFKRIPKTSGFPEIDLLGMLKYASDDSEAEMCEFRVLSCRIAESKVRNWPRLIRDYTVKVEIKGDIESAVDIVPGEVGAISLALISNANLDEQFSVRDDEMSII